MFSVNLHEIMMERINSNGINLDNIINFAVEQYVDESTFAPIIYMDIEMIDGLKHEISLDLTAELVQDLSGNGQTIDSFTKDFDRKMLRRTNLNKILHGNT